MTQEEEEKIEQKMAEAAANAKTGDAAPTTSVNLSNPEDPDEQELVNNPFIFSDNLAVSPNSFVDSRQQHQRKCPPPKYMTEEMLLKQLPTSKEDLMKGLKEQNYGGLICVDKEAIDKQKGVLVDVLKQLTKNILSGLTITHISLPIKIFEPRSSI